MLKYRIYSEEPDKIMIVENKPFTPEFINILKNYTKLHLFAGYNQELNNLPDDIEELHLGYHYNQKLINLPNSIVKLVLGYKYNQTLDYLPLSLRILVLGREFNQQLDNLPNTITEIYIGPNFNNSLDTLPESVKIINFDCNPHDSKFNQPINKLPSGLVKFKLTSKNYNYPLILPDTVTHLDLSMCDKFNQPLILPPRLKDLYLGNSFNQEIKVFPETLTIVVIYSDYKYPLTNIKFNGYLHISLPRFSQPISSLPPVFTSVSLNTEYKYKSDAIKSKKNIIFETYDYI